MHPKAWTKLVMFLIHHMRDGYHAQIRAENAAAPPAVASGNTGYMSSQSKRRSTMASLLVDCQPTTRPQTLIADCMNDAAQMQWRGSCSRGRLAHHASADERTAPSPLTMSPPKSASSTDRVTRRSRFHLSVANTVDVGCSMTNIPRPHSSMSQRDTILMRCSSDVNVIN